ncbi:MAG TPA: hypothetical protein DEQ14_08680, partial [Treponema sp.]|nr:hypothetical protein [Treponema sp.]
MELLLITNQYPYNFGDVAFIKPEILFLSKAFEKVHVITTSNLSHPEKTELPPNVQASFIPHDSQYNNSKRIKSIFFSTLQPLWIMSIFFKELGFLINQKKINTKTLKNSIFFLLDANIDAIFLNKYLENNPKIEIVYTYWFERKTLSALINKKRMGRRILCVTRAHGYDLYEFRNENNYQPYKKWMDRYVDRVFFISIAGYNYYLKKFAKSHIDKYVIARLGIENPYSWPIFYDSKHIEERTKNHLNIISCSNIIPVKRIHLIIEAL